MAYAVAPSGRPVKIRSGGCEQPEPRRISRPDRCLVRGVVTAYDFDGDTAQIAERGQQRLALRVIEFVARRMRQYGKPAAHRNPV